MTAQQAAAQIRKTISTNLPTVTYNWPATAEALGRTPGEQLGEALVDVGWIEEALADQMIGGQKIEDLIAQLHHSVELFWRCLALRNGQDYVDAVFQRHEDGLKKERVA